MAQKYYAFLDVALDVYFSIVLYNAFVAFSGLNKQAVLLALAVLIMLNYWWTERSAGGVPKHYLIDFYLTTCLMFGFTVWPNYFGDLSKFLFVAAFLFLFDALHSILAIYVHSERSDEPDLRSYMWADLLAGSAYLIMGWFLKETTWLNLALVWLPYVILMAVFIKRRLLPLKFVDDGDQPY